MEFASSPQLILDPLSDNKIEIGQMRVVRMAQLEPACKFRLWECSRGMLTLIGRRRLKARQSICSLWLQRCSF